MKKRNIIKTMQKLDSLSLPEKEKILENCAAAALLTTPEPRTTPKTRRFSPRKIAVLAMVALLLVAGGVTVVAQEAKAYNEAIDFFEEYNLSAEGFSRSEIKKIYRDIVSESFTYEKTEEALASGLEGYEIQAKPLDSDGLKRLWMVGYVWGVEDQQQTVEAGVEYGFVQAYNPQTREHYGQLFKMKGDQQIWRKRLDDLYIYDARAVGDKIMVAGNLLAKGVSTQTVRVCLLDSESNVIWQKDYNSRMHQPGVNYILYDEGNCTLFTASNDCMWILTIDMEGNLVSERYAEYDARGEWIKKVVPMGDGYLMLKGDRLMQEKDGKVQSTVTFGNGDDYYEITDMVEFNGLVYLSGRIVPSIQYESGKWSKGLYGLYQEQFGGKTPSAEEQLQFMKDHHTAVLLVCDPDSGEPQQFYTIPGASGSHLSVNGKQLDWLVNRYVGAEMNANETYYISTGYFATIKADVWQYVFSPYGQVVGEKDTGSSIEFEG